MDWVIHADGPAARDVLGGKAAALRALGDAGFDVPGWFVVPPSAFVASTTDAQRRVWDDAKDDNTGAAIVREVEPKAALVDALRDALSATSLSDGRLAVRSSAADEDGAAHSFAGQFESFLFVEPDDVPAKVAAVWRSGFSERVIAYRNENNLGAGSVPAVLVQRMIDADAAGVAFAADPVSGDRDVAVVSAVRGVGESLVSGEADADTFRVGRDEVILDRALRDATASDAAIDDAQAVAVAELAWRASDHFGRPQDIEWAVKDGRLYLLQSRPITTIGAATDRSGRRRVWDNSNIAESYAGVTTPLTFSFARSIYESVYRQFCVILGVSPRKIDAGRQTFANMLGLVRGRVYYNLLNWYRVLAMLPGFRFNRRFMEQMMGVKEALPNDVLATLETTTRGQRIADAWSLMRSAFGLMRHHRRIDRTIERFYARLNDALCDPNPPLEEQSLDELAASYRDLEDRLLLHWDAPLINDFLAMIFFGLLGKLTTKWCDDKDGTLHNELLIGGGDMVSAEPARRIQDMAALIAEDDAAIDLFCTGGVDAILAEIERHAALREAYVAYLDKFGDRCLEELKLESPTLRDDAMTLLRSIGHVARRMRETEVSPPQQQNSPSRDDAEQRALSAIGPRLGRRIVWRWVLRHARARVRDRENLRFERTRLFGRVRRLFVEIGHRLCDADRLDDPRDVFYLTAEEVLGIVEGTAVATDLRGLVKNRRAEFEAYRNDTQEPPGRFETFGPAHLSELVETAGDDDAHLASVEDVDGDARRGLGCCAGVVRGRARVVHDPRGVEVRAGEILVASRTDPGWIMLFPAAAGVVVEHGSLLSHSAIVARELGIPAVVGVAGLMSWLKDGDVIEMDGRAGVVRRVTDLEPQIDTD